MREWYSFHADILRTVRVIQVLNLNFAIFLSDTGCILSLSLWISFHISPVWTFRLRSHQQPTMSLMWSCYIANTMLRPWEILCCLQIGVIPAIDYKKKNWPIKWNLQNWPIDIDKALEPLDKTKFIMNNSILWLLT